jgi:hypothetical protein
MTAPLRIPKAGFHSYVGEGTDYANGSLVGYEPVERTGDGDRSTRTKRFTLREKASELNTVVITAGSFEASDTRKITIVKHSTL